MSHTPERSGRAPEFLGLEHGNAVLNKTNEYSLISLRIISRSIGMLKSIKYCVNISI